MVSLWDKGLGFGDDNVAVFMESHRPHIKDLKGNQITYFLIIKIGSHEKQ